MSWSLFSNDVCSFCGEGVNDIRRHMSESIQCHMKAVIARKANRKAKKKPSKPTYERVYD
jgi:hypothetical protein